MYCSECGNQIKKDYSFCTNCGTKANQVSFESLNLDTMVIKNKFSIKLSNEKLKNIIILLVVLVGGGVFSAIFQSGTKNPYKVIDTFIDSFYYNDIKGFIKYFPPGQKEYFETLTAEKQELLKENLSISSNNIRKAYGDKWIENISIKSDYNSNYFYIEDIATKDIILEVYLIEVDGKIYIEEFYSALF